MSASHDLQTVNSLISLSMYAVEETRSRCQAQLPRLYNQRLALNAKRLAREAKQKDELRELYSSLRLVTPVDKE